VALVHAETSTGARQPIAEIAPLCHEREALLLVDAVTSLGGLELEVDGWGIDACASATQKCLSCPPGLAPVTFGPRALERIRTRRRKVVSWYLDVGLIQRYWAEESRAYHHTAPIAMTYALHEALAMVLEEGLEARWARHARHGRALVAGLGALGFVPVPAAGCRLPVLTAVRLPEGLDEAPARRRLLADHGIEIGGGLGPLAGEIWRIGLMGESARRRHVLALLTAVEEILVAAGLRRRIGDGLDAAVAAYGGEG
jgi:alanine-glyoxylate transaminase/serine-glyoxylate transaminase/serine-pyruvate transaminase